MKKIKNIKKRKKMKKLNIIRKYKNLRKMKKSKLIKRLSQVLSKIYLYKIQIRLIDKNLEISFLMLRRLALKLQRVVLKISKKKKL